MMKKLLASLLLVAVPLAVLAQTADKTEGSTKSRVQVKTKANQMATGIMAAEAALTPAELAIAERVYQGKLPCDLGTSVTVKADPKAPGYFNVQVKQQKFRMFPVETSTGAIRLEDRKAGAVWLQLANKSMLMNQKLGQRLADTCMSPDQVAVADKMNSSPATSVLDAPAAVAIK